MLRQAERLGRLLKLDGSAALAAAFATARHVERAVTSVRGTVGAETGAVDMLAVLTAPACLIILAWCANVGNRQLARGMSRRTNLNIRRALGATGRRIVRQLLVETFLLAATAAVASVWLARRGLPVVLQRFDQWPASIAGLADRYQTTTGRTAWTLKEVGAWALDAGEPQNRGRRTIRRAIHQHLNNGPWTSGGRGRFRHGGPGPFACGTREVRTSLRQEAACVQPSPRAGRGVAGGARRAEAPSGGCAGLPRRAPGAARAASASAADASRARAEAVPPRSPSQCGGPTGSPGGAHEAGRRDPGAPGGSRPGPPRALRAVARHQHGGRGAGRIEAVRAEMEEFFGGLGLDVDAPDLRVGMTDEELAASAASFIEQMQRGLDDAAAREQAPGRRKTRRELRQEEQARRIEEARRNSIGAVYRRLAKALHPDLERDPAERQRKSALMQRVTAAHADNDLHTLLRLEVELVHGDAGDVTTLAAETLDAYTQMLKQQVAELEAEELELLLHPRYQPIVAMGPFGPLGMIDVHAEVHRLDAEIDDLRGSVELLSAPNALREVKALVRLERDVSRRHMPPWNVTPSHPSPNRKGRARSQRRPGRERHPRR